jgi:hypothetical protein
MSFSSLPLSYCANVHPGRTVDEILHGLTTYTAETRRRLNAPLAAGLWIPASAVDELVHDDVLVNRLVATLDEADLCCYTLNAFPHGDFHGERVKENVYLPEWSTEERFDYTLDCAKLLCRLLPSGTEGSLSTVPLGFKGFREGDAEQADFLDDCINVLLRLARQLDLLHDETGQVIRVAIEPEPRCVLETTTEAIEFFERLYERADDPLLETSVRRHLGLCYDVCHQAVEFEEVGESIGRLNAAGIRINKVHITCAIHLDRPGEHPEALRELARYVEPRYLHQTFAKTSAGEIVHVDDLSPELCHSPPEEFADADAWRVHFHVPVHQESLGPLATTRPQLREALAAVAELEYAPHLEVETYTWGVLPEGEERPSLVEGLVQELEATGRLLDELGSDR